MEPRNKVLVLVVVAIEEVWTECEPFSLPSLLGMVVRMDHTMVAAEEINPKAFHILLVVLDSDFSMKLFHNDMMRMLVCV